MAEGQEGCQRRHGKPSSDDGAHEIDSGNVVFVDMLPLHARLVRWQHNKTHLQKRFLSLQ